MAKQHIEYIDIAKGIGILLVIWGHIITNSFSREFLYSFHMPLFFLLSGMFFKSEKYNSFFLFLCKRGKRLLVPLALYSIVTWGIWVGYNKFFGNSIDIWSPLFQTVIAQGSGEYFKHNSPLWFIPCLFAIEIMYYFIAKLNREMIIPICFAISGISMLLEHFYGLDYLLLLPWNLDAAMMALPFYAIGNLFAYHPIWHEKIESYASSKPIIMGGLTTFLFALTAFLTAKFPFVSMGYSNYGNEYIFHIRALIGIAFICCLSVVASQLSCIGKIKNSLLWMGQKSLDVMCTHVPIKGFIIVLIAMLLHTATIDVTDNLLFSILIFALTVVIDIVVVMSIDRIKNIWAK